MLKFLPLGLIAAGLPSLNTMMILSYLPKETAAYAFAANILILAAVFALLFANLAKRQATRNT